MDKFTKESLERRLILAREEAEWIRTTSRGKENLDNPLTIDAMLENEGVRRLDLMPALRQANPIEYIEWLKGYLNTKGGSVTHHYDYGMPSEFLFATGDFKMYGNCGATSFQVIVPEGVKFLGGSLGHCNIYFMDGFTKQGGWVPMYNDTCFKAD